MLEGTVPTSVLGYYLLLPAALGRRSQQVVSFSSVLFGGHRLEFIGCIRTCRLRRLHRANRGRSDTHHGAPRIDVTKSIDRILLDQGGFLNKKLDAGINLLLTISADQIPKFGRYFLTVFSHTLS